MSKQRSKTCKGCGRETDSAAFVDLCGKANPRGRYCRDCHEEHAKAAELAAIEAEESAVRKFRIMYGPWRKHYAYPTAFTRSLYLERDYCPYCGKRLPLQYVPQADNTEPFRGRAHLDHMDPLCRGGEDSIRNVVYTCDPCNYRKGDALFVDWLRSLAPQFQELSRQIYIEKHGHLPEQFMAGESEARMDGIGIELDQPEEELLREYPTPMEIGPPRDYLIKLLG